MKDILTKAKADMTGDPAPSAQHARPGSDDGLDPLAKLADLHDRGGLTDEEFAAGKARILVEG